MAQSAVTGTDLQNLRTGDQYIDEVACFITPLTQVATATVDAVPTFSPYVSLTVTWNSGMSDVDIGQLFVVSDGTNTVSYGVIRLAPGASTIYISVTPLGGSAYATDIERAIQVGDTITVYSHHPLVGIPSRIGSDRNFYKFWDVSYSNQNSQPPPVCNVGTWQAAQVDSGSDATFTLPRSGTNTSFAFGAATISSYSWTLPAGVSLVSGYALTDDVIQVTAGAGTYQVSCTLTDSNAKTHTAYLWLFVSDGTTGTSLSERYSVEISNDEQTVEGRTLSLIITGESLESILYPGAGILLREWSKFNDSDLTGGVLIDSFVGYIGELEIAHDGNIGTATATVESPFIYAARIPQPSQVVEEKASPANWTQATSTLTNPRGFLYYAIKWHAPALLDMHDLDAGYTTPRRKNAVWQKGSLADAMTTAAEYLAGSVGSASDGTTVLRANPLYMSNTNRNNLENIITWLDRDLRAPFNYVERMTQALNEARTGAFAYDGTTVKAWLAGKFWGQGVGTATLANFTVTSSEGLDRVLEVAGHFYAEQNRNILEIPLKLTRNQDIIDPAYWLWCSLTVSSDYDTLGNGFTSQRCLVKNITREWVNDAYGMRKTIQLGLQPETFGQPGEEIPIQNAAAYQIGGYSITIPTNFTPSQDDSAFGGASLMIVNTSNGGLAITYNYQAASPNWLNLGQYLNGETVHDFTIDYDSPYFSNGNNASYALRLYVVTSSGAGLTIWRFDDILSTTDVTSLKSITMNDSSCSSEAHIENGETNPNLVVVAWHDQTGTSYTRSTNSGSTWSSMANIGSSISDTGNDNAVIGLDVDGSNQLVTAPNASSEYGAYLATTDSGSFTRLTNTPASTAPYYMIKIVPDNDDAYMSGLVGGNVIEEFDGTDFIGTTFHTTGDCGSSSNPTGAYENLNVAFAYGACDSNTLPISDQPTLDTGGNGNPGNCASWTPVAVGAKKEWRSGGFAHRFQCLFNPYASGGSDTAISDLTFDYYLHSDIVSTIFMRLTFADANVGTLVYEDNVTLTGDAWTSISAASDFTQTSGTPTAIGDIVIDASVLNHIKIEFRTSTTIDISVSTVDVRIDNIYLNDGSGGSSQTLYSVTDFDGTDTWVDVSPAANEIPVRPHDFAIDIANSSVLNTHITSSNKWYSSTDAGSSWTTEATSNEKRVFYSAGDAIAAAGTGKVSLALDGSTFEDKLGNLSTAIGAIGTIKRLQAL